MKAKKNMIIAVAVTAIVTSLLTGAVKDITRAAGMGVSLQKITMVKKMLSEYSLFEADEEKIADYASMAMAAAVDDPYTVYYPKEEFSSYKDNIMSTYIGIGATLGANTEKNQLVVVSPMEDSPAEKAGLKSGDEIVAIDGKQYEANQLSEAATYLKKGDEGSGVVITVKRDGEQFDISVTREKIIKNSVKSKMLDGETGYLRITDFESKSDNASKNTYDEFCEHLTALQSAGMKKLVIDLRDNPGGDLNVVCNIADVLLPEGLITYTEDKHGKRVTVNSDANCVDIPIAVLVNGGSASASEVLTGALKDNGKAVVVGTKTYGKGIVQTVYPFSDGSGMSVTTAKYYTPSGVCIHQIGIEPDITVEAVSDKAVSDLTAEEDVQLKKALEALDDTAR